MEKHLTVVALINITFGVVFFFIGLALFLAVAGGGVISGDPQAMLITGAVGSGLGIFFTVLAVPGIIGGIGLLKRKGWARILMLMIAVLDLFNIPIGTLIGAYTIWVLLNDQTIRLFDRQ